MGKEAKILIAILVVVVGGGLFAAFSSSRSETVQTDTLVKSNNYKKGNGAVQVVEFGDFQCPACAQTQPVVKQIIDEYGDKITFVYRHFPLPIHKNAVPAAEAAEAAGAQGKFWEMYDVLFQKQNEWGTLASTTEAFTRYAGDIGLDTAKFKQELESRTYKSVVEDDQSDGYDVGIQGTPTFFVNGERQSSFDYDTLKNAIDAKLG